ncbi:MAG: glycosyltransferase [Patescibacteria group bacterium]|nr:glycosyltransferase [Patescibacteria group bacterium]
MNLTACVVTHNRLELTKRCIESFLATVSVPYYLVVVDNASTDGTLEWLIAEEDSSPDLILPLRENLYPGRACNVGWAAALPFNHDANLLLRADNDVEFLSGWCDELQRIFEDPKVGQVGLLEQKFEQGCSNVGGNCAIRRELWDAGLRWNEAPWSPSETGGTRPYEDGLMSEAIMKAGYRIARVERECIKHNGWDWDAYPNYYEKTAADRGYKPDWLRGHFDRMRAL